MFINTFALNSMKWYTNQVFNEDVLSVLRRMPDGCIDMIYGDPDYNVGINYHGVNYTRQWQEYIDWYCALARECMRVLKTDATCFC